MSDVMSLQETKFDSDEMDTHHRSATDRHVRILRSLLTADSHRQATVEQPLPCHSSCGGFSPLSFDRAGPLVRSSQRWTCSWARLFTQRLWTFGYAEEALASIFDALPAGFCAAIQNASDRLASLILKAQACISDGVQSCVSDGAAAAEPTALATLEKDGEVQVCGSQWADVFLECLEDIWERDSGVGFIEFAFHPATQVPHTICLLPGPRSSYRLAPACFSPEIAYHSAENWSFSTPSSGAST